MDENERKLKKAQTGGGGAASEKEKKKNKKIDKLKKIKDDLKGDLEDKTRELEDLKKKVPVGFSLSLSLSLSLSHITINIFFLLKEKRRPR